MIPTHATSKFRTDINGLRAWAVIAVLFFHFQIPGFDAGFMGVDIFFVISGFLMTSIIVESLLQNKFSIWSFYMARFRRIIPALIFLIFALTIVGWFWLPTPDYKDFINESVQALGFVSNTHYYGKAGYFDSGAYDKLLLHTWSLGIEMQFYILFPILVALLWKLRPSEKFVFYSLVVIFSISFTTNIIVSHSEPVAAFYLLPSRGWELAVGGLTYFIGKFSVSKLQNSSRLYFYILGLILIVVGVFVINNQVLWPSYWALLPVLGSAFIIFAKQENIPLLHGAAFQGLGNISYSLYLWHWPMVVALFFAGFQDEFIWIALAITLSLLLAYISYKWIESPIRKTFVQHRLKKQFLYLIVSVLALRGLLEVVSIVGFENRLPEVVSIAAAEHDNRNPLYKQCFQKAEADERTGCMFGADTIGAVLVGDSHADATINALGKTALSYNKGVLLYGRPGCPFMDNVVDVEDATHLKCQKLNNWAYEEFSKLPNNVPIVSISRTSTYLVGYNEPDAKQGLNDLIVHFGTSYSSRHDFNYIKEFQDILVSTACSIAKDRPFYLVRPFPEFRISVPRTLSRNMMFKNDYRDIKISLKEYHERHKLVWEAQDRAVEECGVKVLNPLPYLCDNEYCYGSKNGRPLYFDDDHLSEYGNRFLMPMFEEVFKNELPVATQ